MGLHRSVDRAGLELNRLQEAQDQQRESFEARLDGRVSDSTLHRPRPT